MTETQRRPPDASRTASRWRRLRTAVAFLLGVLVVAWASLAIYYSNLPWHGVRLALAIGFAAFGAWASWIARTRRARLAYARVSTTRHVRPATASISRSGYEPRCPALARR
ncbi:MAG TPA: hypothetical protein VK047_10475 [Zeimonas sp.]|nr:hypothetical protein [Zeimonas sp.]